MFTKCGSTSIVTAEFFVGGDWWWDKLCRNRWGWAWTVCPLQNSTERAVDCLKFSSLWWFITPNLADLCLTISACTEHKWKCGQILGHLIAPQLHTHIWIFADDTLCYCVTLSDSGRLLKRHSTHTYLLVSALLGWLFSVNSSHICVDIIVFLFTLSAS